jgi:hypothetical protein
MKRQGTEKAVDHRVLLESYANRWRGIFEAARCQKFAVPFAESKIIAEPPVSETSEGRHLSFAEIFIRFNRDEWRAHDFLAVVSIALSLAPARTLTFFVGPATLRNQSSLISAGVVMTDVPVGRVLDGAGESWEVSTLILRIKNGSPAQKILETIENHIPVIDYEADLSGSLTVAESVLDRLKVIYQSPYAAPVLAGEFSSRDEADPTRYVAIMQPPNDRDRKRPLFVKGSRLFAGQPTIDSRRNEPMTTDSEPGIPTRHQDFALLRFGAKLEMRAQTRSIHQLRRERAVGGSAFLEKTEKAAGTSYLDRDARLRKTRQLTAIFGSEGLQRLPVVTPLIIEVASNLIPLIEAESSNLSRQFQEVLDVMKQGLRYELGIEVPGVRVRGNEGDLPPGAYNFMIDEIPLVTGTAYLDRFLCNATIDELKSIDVPAEATTNPANGNDAAWVQPEHYDIVKERGKSVRDDGLYLWNTIEYIMLHLSAVIRKNAADFLGIRAVADLIRSKHKTAYDRLLSAPGGLARFTAVLRVLLEEEVPINELAAISERYLGLTASGVASEETIEELRCLDGVRPALRYARESVAVCELGENFVKLIRNGIINDGDAVVLALEPESTQKALSAVRNEVTNLPPGAQNVFLLVEDWQHRRPIRKLVELEFPHLRVLSRRELMDLPGSVNTVSVIEVDG